MRGSEQVPREVLAESLQATGLAALRDALAKQFAGEGRREAA
jgi:hypothetical protein